MDSSVSGKLHPDHDYEPSPINTLNEIGLSEKELRMKSTRELNNYCKKNKNDVKSFHLDREILKSFGSNQLDQIIWIKLSGSNYLDQIIWIKLSGSNYLDQII